MSAQAAAPTAAPPADEPAPCLFIKKRPVGLQSKRKHQEDNARDGEDGASVVVPADKRRARGAVVATTKNPKKESFKVTYESTHSAKREGPDDMGATAIVQVDTAFENDAQAVFERSQQIQSDILTGEQADDIYRGQAGYQQFLTRKETMSGNAYKGFSAKGPLRAPTNMRATVRWDYQPDICKDYKETGFCGYGDNCKFMHDRSDYKSGWQIDRELERGEGAPKVHLIFDRLSVTTPVVRHKLTVLYSFEVESSDDEDDKLPFACYICREPFTRPVVTRCGHHFCEQCALKHHKTSLKCFVCGSKTEGIFSPAKDLLAKIQKMKEKSAAADVAESLPVDD